MSSLRALGLLALLGCSESAPAQEQSSGGPGALTFSQHFGTSEADFARAAAVAASGETYVAGYTDGAFEAENAGSWDAFLTRFDAAGDIAWSRQWGSAGADFAQGVLVAPAGGVFVAGYGQGDIGDQVSTGGHDAFLTRFGSGGELEWTRQWGTAADEYVYAAASASGGVVVSGYTEGALAGQANAGEADAFVSFLDENGELGWTRQWGTTATDYGQAVHTDKRGHVLVAGYTAGTLGEDPSLGAEDAFLIKLDADGEVLWLRQWGSTTTDYGLSVTSDAALNLYVTGYSYGSTSEDPSTGAEDAFLTKFDASGALLWTRQWGTLSADNARSVSLAPNGDVLVVGDTEGSLEGNVSAGERDAFLARFSPDGELLFIAQWGGAEREYSLSVAAASDEVYVAGYSETESLRREALLSQWSFP